ncbi:MAG TPA: hypothetical protein ENN81_03370 [Phycisphaerales bacterium]|nr:hypothetical protein [Phycisphaerales bacterium]
MFRTVSIAGFVALAVAMVVHAVSCKAAKGARRASTCGAGPLIAALGKLAGFVVLASFAVLVLTGFWPRVVLKEAICGYGLMLHATAAPVFIAALAALAVLGADSNRLNKSYLPWLNKLLGRKGGDGEALERFELSRKVCFWLILMLALPLAMSIVLSMLPLFGTHMQEVMAEVHRYSALAISLVLIFGMYLYVRARA